MKLYKVIILAGALLTLAFLMISCRSTAKFKYDIQSGKLAEAEYSSGFHFFSDGEGKTLLDLNINGITF